MCINGTRTGPSQAFQKGLDLTERICAGQAALTFISLSVKYLSWRFTYPSFPTFAAEGYDCHFSLQH